MEKKDNNFFVIILPFFNESILIIDLLTLIESKIKDLNHHFKLIFVNDGSTDNSVNLILKHEFRSKNISKEIIELSSNSGHQNAIRQGLIYTKNNYISDIKGVIIMDSDGEDNPDAIFELTKKQNFEVVFVTRGKREENLTFKISYFFYKLIFKLVTGNQINFGNYSMLNPKVLNAIADKHFFHYSAFLSKQRFKIEKIKYDRKKRLNGNSKMSYKNLLIHALKSFIEYHEELIYFQIKAFVLVLAIFSSLSGYILYTKFISHTAIIGWSSNLILGLTNGLLIIFSSIILSTLLSTIKNRLDQNSINAKKVDSI